MFNLSYANVATAYRRYRTVDSQTLLADLECDEQSAQIGNGALLISLALISLGIPLAGSQRIAAGPLAGGRAFTGANRLADWLGERFATPEVISLDHGVAELTYPLFGRRGIVGFDGERVRITANPHLVWGWGREDSRRSPDLNLDLKVLYKASETLAWGVEAYTDGGRVNRLRPGDGDRTIYLVTEFETRIGAIHVGLGQGFKETPERYLLKGVWTTRF